MRKKPVQPGRSERRAEAYPLRYVEDLNEARTPLADFFRILLDLCPTTLQLLHNLRHRRVLHVVEGQPVRFKGTVHP